MYTDCMMVSADGGSIDPSKNLQLATVLKWAKEQNVPKENIEKALAKVSVQRCLSSLARLMLRLPISGRTREEQARWWFYIRSSGV
jgi:Transcriptional regulator